MATLLPKSFLLRRFLALVSRRVVATLFDEAASLGLTSLKQQWLYMVHDTSAVDTDAADILTKARDGANVAMVYNASQTSPDGCQVITMEYA